MSRSLNFNELIPEYEKQKKILNWNLNKKKKEIEREFDFTDFSEDEKNKFLAPKFENLENQYTAAKDNLEYIKNELKRATERDGVNDVIEKMKKKGIYDEVMGTSKPAEKKEESAAEKTQNRSEAMKGNQNAKKWGLSDEDLNKMRDIQVKVEEKFKKEYPKPMSEYSETSKKNEIISELGRRTKDPEIRKLAIKLRGFDNLFFLDIWRY